MRSRDGAAMRGEVLEHRITVLWLCLGLRGLVDFRLAGDRAARSIDFLARTQATAFDVDRAIADEDQDAGFLLCALGPDLLDGVEDLGVFLLELRQLLGEL